MDLELTVYVSRTVNLDCSVTESRGTETGILLVPTPRLLGELGRIQA